MLYNERMPGETGKAEKNPQDQYRKTRKEEIMIDVLEELLHPETLPLQKPGRKAHYEGSIDKTGGNSDWDWHLYQDENKEWVLFEQYGPG